MYKVPDTTTQGIFAATQSAKYVFTFSAIFNALERIKLLVTKLQKYNEGVCKTYQIIEKLKNVGVTLTINFNSDMTLLSE